MKYTPEERAAYYATLRLRWKRAKEALSKDEGKIMAELVKSGLQVSPVSYFMIKCTMEDLGLEGIPYIDAKTYQGWRASGYTVKKGEKSFGDGITWVDCSKDDDDESKIFPKAYALFHKSQVEKL